MLKGNFRATENTNKQWRFRVLLVKELESWVCENLSTHHASWDRKLDKKATLEGKRRKAAQYVIEHLALGKMKYPLEDTDPLFTILGLFIRACEFKSNSMCSIGFWCKQSIS